MHAHLAAAALLATTFVTAPLAGQTPTPLPPPPPGDPGKPLITEAPIKPGEQPAQIPETPADSITAAEIAVLAAHDATIAATQSLAPERLSARLAPTDRGAMIADGRIVLTQDEVIETTRRDFAALRSVRYDFSHRHITVLSTTTALIVADGQVTATTSDGAAFTRPFAQTIVFTRVGDVWKVAHLHSSSPPATLGR